jgi:predicted DNA-binding antitoxin AbrB/MazE fold protein
MNLTVEAIYEEGVLKLTQPLALPEGTHVSVVITPAETLSTAKTPAQILAEITALPLSSENQIFSNRDHDAVLYSPENNP